jgi:phage terminase large subunit
MITPFLTTVKAQQGKQKKLEKRTYSHFEFGKLISNILDRERIWSQSKHDKFQNFFYSPASEETINKFKKREIKAQMKQRGSKKLVSTVARFN